MHTIKLLLTYYLNISVQAANFSDCPSCRPTNSVKALKAIKCCTNVMMIIIITLPVGLFTCMKLCVWLWCDATLVALASTPPGMSGTHPHNILVGGRQREYI